MIKPTIKKVAIGRRKLLSTIAPTYATKLFYKKTLNKRLDLNNPKTLNEKIQWLKLNTYKDNPLVTKCADKFLAREYVKSIGCGEILNDLIAVWDSVEEIDWSKLPKKFVLKVNHGSGYNIICDNLSKLDINETEEQLKLWLKEDFWKLHAEINYKHIPKKIICEKFIETKHGSLPNDYKFYCFNGEPKYVLLCTERELGKAKYYYFDRNWNLMPYTKDAIENPNIKIDKPEGIDEAFEYAEKLAKPFPFVRVDFYLEQGRTIFGELTFTPARGMDKKRLPEVDRKFGELLKLPM